MNARKRERLELPTYQPVKYRRTNGTSHAGANSRPHMQANIKQRWKALTSDIWMLVVETAAYMVGGKFPWSTLTSAIPDASLR